MENSSSDLLQDALELYNRDPLRGIKKAERLKARGLSEHDAHRLSHLEYIEENTELFDTERQLLLNTYLAYRQVLEPRVEEELQAYEGKMLDIHPRREAFRRRVRMLLEIGISLSAEDAAVEEPNTQEVTAEQAEAVILALQRRFAEETSEYRRQEGMDIDAVVLAMQDRSLNPGVIARLCAMEQSGGCPDVLAETANHYVIGECFSSTPSARNNRTFQESQEQAKAMGVSLMGPWTFVSAFRESEGHSLDYLRSSKSLQEQGWAMEGYHGQSGSRAIITFYPSEVRQGWRGELLVKKRPKTQQ